MKGKHDDWPTHPLEHRTSLHNSAWMTGADISWHNRWWSRKSYYEVVYRSRYLVAQSMVIEEILLRRCVPWHVPISISRLRIWCRSKHKNCSYHMVRIIIRGINHLEFLSKSFSSSRVYFSLCVCVNNIIAGQIRIMYGPDVQASHEPKMGCDQNNACEYVSSSDIVRCRLVRHG